MNPPKISNDLEWIEVEPGHWVLFKDGKPFDGYIDDCNFTGED